MENAVLIAPRAGRTARASGRGHGAGARAVSARALRVEPTASIHRIVRITITFTRGKRKIGPGIEDPTDHYLLSVAQQSSILLKRLVTDDSVIMF